MLDRESFCIILDGMKDEYDRSNKIYDVLKQFDVYVDVEFRPIDLALESLIDLHFNSAESYEILNYAYPIFEREEISSGELYDRIMKDREKEEEE